ncbi:hypothetical protein, partial [Pectobacterium versatile]|uniref:hypothetical protein n=1 Tax=Pectobacterium versatile TaxID=2488639 RepID=UPI001B36C28E
VGIWLYGPLATRSRRGASFRRVLRLIRSLLSPQHNFLRRITAKPTMSLHSYKKQQTDRGRT